MHAAHAHIPYLKHDVIFILTITLTESKRWRLLPLRQVQPSGAPAAAPDAEPAPRARHSAAMYMSKMFVFGGIKTEAEVRSMDALDHAFVYLHAVTDPEARLLQRRDHYI